MSSKKHRSTWELYDIDPKVLSDMTYEEALQYKLKSGKEHHYQLVHSNCDDESLLSDIRKGIELTRYLLKELQC